MDKNWRPVDWNAIKKNIVEQTPIIFSPGTGYAKGRIDKVMEKTASAIINAILKEQSNGK